MNIQYYTKDLKEVLTKIDEYTKKIEHRIGICKKCGQQVTLHVVLSSVNGLYFIGIEPELHYVINAMQELSWCVGSSFDYAKE